MHILTQLNNLELNSIDAFRTKENFYFENKN